MMFQLALDRKVKIETNHLVTGANCRIGDDVSMPGTRVLAFAFAHLLDDILPPMLLAVEALSHGFHVLPTPVLPIVDGLIAFFVTVSLFLAVWYTDEFGTRMKESHGTDRWGGFMSLLFGYCGLFLGVFSSYFSGLTGIGPQAPHNKSQLVLTSIITVFGMTLLFIMAHARAATHHLRVADNSPEVMHARGMAEEAKDNLDRARAELVAAKSHVIGVQTTQEANQDAGDALNEAKLAEGRCEQAEEEMKEKEAMVAFVTNKYTHRSFSQWFFAIVALLCVFVGIWFVVSPPFLYFRVQAAEHEEPWMMLTTGLILFTLGLSIYSKAS